MVQQILLPSVRVTYCYTTNQLTAQFQSKIRTMPCRSTALESEALLLAEQVAGRSLTVIIANPDNFLFR